MSVLLMPSVTSRESSALGVDGAPALHSNSRVPVFADSALLQPVSPETLGRARVPAATLLDGFARTMQFLIEAEAEFLCGVPLYSRSRERLNYRVGYYTRKLRTPAGACLVRVPHLNHLYPRVSMLKRAKRLSPSILDTLALVHSGGATIGHAATLIQSIWTISLPDAQLERLTARLVVLLNDWRHDAALAATPERP